MCLYCCAKVHEELILLWLISLLWDLRGFFMSSNFQLYFKLVLVDLEFTTHGLEVCIEVYCNKIGECNLKFKTAEYQDPFSV